MVNITFSEESIEKFNHYNDTSLHGDMSFEDATDNIEDCGNNYFYASMFEEDIVEVIKGEWEIASQLDLNCVYIIELGLYIALQP